MFTKAFWVAAFERAIKTAAQSVIVVWGVGDGIMNAFHVQWEDTLGIALGGFVISVLTSLVSGAVSGNPSLGNAEVVNPNTANA